MTQKMNTDYFKYHTSFSEWINTANNGDTRKNTRIKHIEQFLLYLSNIGIDVLQKLKYDDLVTYFQHLSTIPHRFKAQKRTNHTLNEFMCSHNLFAQYMKRFKINIPNYVAYLPSDEKTMMDVLSQQEVRSLYDAIDDSTALGQRDKAYLNVVYAAGIRRKEASSLDISDLNQDANTIHIKDPKSDKERIVPIPQSCMQQIIEYIDFGRKELAIKDEKALFVSNGGKYWGERVGGAGMYLRIKQIIKTTKCIQDKNIGVHTFRRSLATHLYDNGMSLRSIQKILGHAHAETTDNYIKNCKRKNDYKL